MSKELKVHIKSNEKLKKIGYLLYAMLASFFAFKYFAEQGVKTTDVLATIAAITCVPVAFWLTRERTKATEEFKAKTGI